ncbi:MAG: hypothetical protein WCJ72_19215 [Chryseobacterium sp.]|jgi:hypothetical protein
MPQLDMDLFDDFLFFAFIALLFGFGDEEGEEGLVEMATDSFLAQFYLENKKELVAQKALIKSLIVSSVVHQNIK